LKKAHNLKGTRTLKVTRTLKGRRLRFMTFRLRYASALALHFLIKYALMLDPRDALQLNLRVTFRLFEQPAEQGFLNALLEPPELF